MVEGDTLCTLTAIGNDNRGNLIGFTSAHCGGPGERVAAEGAEAAGVLGTMVAGNDALDYAVIQFDPQKVAAGQQRQGIPDRRPRPRSGVRRRRLQAGPDDGLFVRRDVGAGRAAWHDRQPGVRAAGRLRRTRHRQQPAGRHDPRCLLRGTADVRGQVHPAAHPGGDDVDQHAAGRHHRQEPTGLGLRPGRLHRPRNYLLARIASNTLGSTNVDVSPSSRPSATSRSRRRMILPLRVFGSSGTT